MGYYCTVPQCTSLAGKTKNVKFHRFPRDDTLAHRWNEILHRNKPYTKYSKVCSLHFTQADYNITTMGQWKTLSKDAIPTQNLPRLNADGTVMVIRKSRTIKYKPEGGEQHPKKDGHDESAGSNKREWANQSASSYGSSPGRSANTTFERSANTTLDCSANTTLDRSANTTLDRSAISTLDRSPITTLDRSGITTLERSAITTMDTSDSSVHYRLNALNAIANNISPQLKSILQQGPKPVKHDAIMQTEPLDPLIRSREVTPEPTHEKENKQGGPPKSDYRYVEVFSHSKPNPKNYSKESDSFDKEIDYSKNDDLSKAAESYALERNNKRSGSYEVKSPECYKQPDTYNKITEPYKPSESYKKLPETYNKSPESYNKLPEAYNKLPETYNTLPDSYNKSPDPYNKLPQSYNKSPESYNKLPETYNKSPESYDKLPETYSKSPESYDKLPETYNKSPEPYDKLPESYNKSQEAFNKMLAYKTQEAFNKQQEQHESYQSRNGYAEAYPKQQEQYAGSFAHGSVEVLRSQQHSLQMLQQRMSEQMVDDSRFYGSRIKEEELDLNTEEDKFLAYEAQKEDYVTQSEEVENALFTQQQRHHLLQQQQRLMDLYERPTIKTEPDLNRGCETAMQPELSPVAGYYRTEQHVAALPTSENACPLNQGVAAAAYYGQQDQETPVHRQQQMFNQPGAELLIAKQNALAAHTTLWPNSAKRPFCYGENTQLHSQLHPRYEDLARLLNQ